MVGFRKMINIEGRDFFNLSRADAAEMIDAFLEGGNGRYDYAALPEFILVPNGSWLEDLRLRLKFIDEHRRTADEPDGLASGAGRLDLMALACELRANEQK